MSDFGGDSEHWMDFEHEEFERCRDVARHEFGHFTVAKFFGFRSGAVSVAPSAALAGAAGQHEVELLIPLRSLQDVEKHLRSRIMILMAGVLAEALESDYSVDNERAICLSKSTGTGDFSKVRELLQILRGIAFPNTTKIDEANKELQKLSDEIWTETSELVSQYGSFIFKMAKTICEQNVRTVSPKEMSQEELDDHPLVQSTFSPRDH